MNQYTAYTDAHLLKLLKSGDEAAFNEIYQRYWKLLFSIAANKLIDLSYAEEIVQDVFADLWKRRESLSIEYSIKSYLAASVKYQIWSLMARLQKEKRAQENFRIVHISDSSLTMEELEARELFVRLQQKVATLPQKCQLVFELSRNQGLSNRQIAVKLEITEKAVESHITRALRHLRTGIELLVICFLNIF